MEIILGCVGVVALIACIITATIMGYKGELKKVEGWKKLARSIIPELVALFGVVAGYTVVSFVDEYSTTELTKGRLLQCIECGLSNSKMEYDLFVSPDGSTYSFQVPEQYIYCTYVSRSGKEKIAIAGETIKAKEATFIYRYLNEDENRIELSNVPKGVSDFHSLYINVYDSIMSSGSAIFGYNLEDIRYVILDEDLNWLAGGTYNGSTLEVVNAYMGDFIMLLIGNDTQNLHNEVNALVLNMDNLLESEGYRYLDGLLFNNETGDVSVRNFVEHYSDTKNYWSHDIYMMYKDRSFYDVTFKSFDSIDYSGYLFSPNMVMLRTSPEVCDANNNSFGAYLYFTDGTSNTFKILESNYYLLPNAVCLFKAENRIASVQYMLEDYNQVISIPKDIEPDGCIKLELNPTNDIVSDIENSNNDEDCAHEFLTYDRYEELAKIYGDTFRLLKQD